jgi:hypothetical protein
VYHGASALLTLKELVRSYVALVEDGTRVMLRIKALFRARGIKTPGTSVYRHSKRKEWLGPTLESRLSRRLGRVGGHEIGSGEMNIFIVNRQAREDPCGMSFFDPFFQARLWPVCCLSLCRR